MNIFCESRTSSVSSYRRVKFADAASDKKTQTNGIHSLEMHRIMAVPAQNEGDQEAAAASQARRGSHSHQSQHFQSRHLCLRSSVAGNFVHRNLGCRLLRRLPFDIQGIV